MSNNLAVSIVDSKCPHTTFSMHTLFTDHVTAPLPSLQWLTQHNTNAHTATANTTRTYTTASTAGMSLAYGGKACVIWSVPAVTGDSYKSGVSAYLLAWVLSPLCTGCISGALFRCVRFAMLQRSKPSLAMRYRYPLLIALTLLINTVYILCKIADAHGLTDKRFATVVAIAAVSTLLMSSVAVTVGYPALQRFHTKNSSSSTSTKSGVNSNLNSTFGTRLTLKSNRATTVVHVRSCRIVPQENSSSCEETSTENTAFDDALEHKTTVTAAAAALAQFGTTRRRYSSDLNSTKTSSLTKSGTLKKKENKNVLFGKRRSFWLLRTLRRMFLYVQFELNRKPEQMLVGESQYALTVHDTVELFDAATEDMFKHLQVTVNDYQHVCIYTFSYVELVFSAAANITCYSAHR
jgi:phosphate/sulfate permease